MAGSSHLTLFLGLCLAALAFSAPPEADQQIPSDSTFYSEDDASVDDPAHYTEAVPMTDFTLNNISSTIEEIMAEAHIQHQPDSDLGSQTRSKRRPCACSTTVGAYGGRQGTAFVDVPTNPCNAQITDIWIRSGSNVKSIQVGYNFSDGRLQTMPRRGGTGGVQTHIAIPQGGKIMGVFGGVSNRAGYGLVISQLRILALDAGEQLQIYGPYGSRLLTDPSTFAVYGDIKSIFGYYRRFLDGLGFYYEPWGVCGSPCAVN